MDRPTVSNYSELLEESKTVISQCLNDYNLEEIFLSFNGGKDCTVLLDLVIKTLIEFYQDAKCVQKLKVIYIRTNNPFAELESFVYHCQKVYCLNLCVVEGKIKEALENIKMEDPKLRVCLMGTRRSDPFSGKLNFFQETDQSWPQIMRVSPILNWNYHQVWAYLLENNIPYCGLYDLGYTSIGSIDNTIPNPSLQFTDKDGTIKYRPAYLLENDASERNGRLTKNSNPTVNGSH